MTSVADWRIQRIRMFSDVTCWETQEGDVYPLPPKLQRGIESVLNAFAKSLRRHTPSGRVSFTVFGSIVVDCARRRRWESNGEN